MKSKNRDKANSPKLATIAVHAGLNDTAEYGPGTTPIYQTSTFRSTDAVYRAFKEGRYRDELIYTRYNNPSIRAVEMKIAALEGSDDALVFASGMGAISCALEAFLKTGDRLVAADDLYGLSRSLISGRFPSLGVEIEFVPTTDNNAWKKSLSRPAKVVYCEGISNPLLRIADLEVIANFAHRAGAVAIIDNTFATPVNSRPLDFGFDLVLHSGTKYLAGHTDLICGSAAGSTELIQKLWERRLIGGACIDPHAAFLLERGLKTLPLRMERQNRNAGEIARFLQTSNKVTWVSYPDLPSHPQFELAKRQLSGSGGMVAFSLSTDEQALKFMRKLKIIREASSLGGVESVISMPMNTSHARLSELELRSAGITPGTLRLSVGIEDVADLIDDITQGLN
jgi:cystathionine beta-lyase/cystathionine gamma-synthase